MAKQRKVTKKASVKKRAPKAKAKAKSARPKSSGQEREVHYSDLRKVMLASVLKRLT